MLRKRVKRILLIVLSLICFSGAITLPRVSAQNPISLAIVQEILDTGEVYIQDNKAKVQDMAKFGEKVQTKELSRTALLFDNGAAGRLNPSSSVMVGQCVEVQEGALLVSGPVNGCVAGFEVGVQGTIYVIEAPKKDNAKEEKKDNMGNVKVIEGKVKVTKKEADGTTTPVEVKEGEQVDILSSNLLSPIRKITVEEFRSLMSGSLFTGFQIPITPGGVLKRACENIFKGFVCTEQGIPTISTPVPVPVPRLPF